jgi:hypothetical protein
VFSKGLFPLLNSQHEVIPISNPIVRPSDALGSGISKANINLSGSSLIPAFLMPFWASLLKCFVFLKGRT